MEGGINTTNSDRSLLPPRTYSKCSICLGYWIKKPTVTKCGHMFCYSCLIVWMDCKLHPTCPMCQQSVEYDQIIRIYNSIVENVDNAHSGSEDTGTVSEPIPEQRDLGDEPDLDSSSYGFIPLHQTRITSQPFLLRPNHLTQHSTRANVTASIVFANRNYRILFMAALVTVSLLYWRSIRTFIAGFAFDSFWINPFPTGSAFSDGLKVSLLFMLEFSLVVCISPLWWVLQGASSP